MPDVVLIYPTGGNVSALTSKRLPIGLLAVAAPLVEEGYNVKIIDMQTDARWRNTLVSCLRSNPVCIGIGCTTGKQILYAVEAAKIVKENSEVPVVFGGVHASILPEQTLQNEHIDIVVRGEGDITFYGLVKALEKGGQLKNIDGISYKDKRDGGKERQGAVCIRHNRERQLITELDSLPELPFNLVNVKQYCSVDYSGRGEPSIDLFTSKGCPFGCKFCYNLQFNKSRWRNLSVEKALYYVGLVNERYGIRNIHFVDDNMGGSQKHLMGMIREIINEGYDINWGTNGIRVNNISAMSDEELRLMKKSGCRELGIGVESANRRILELINKRITLEQVSNVNRRLANTPITIKYSFMIGFPTETKEEINQTVKYALGLAQQNKNAWTGIFPYMPYPGTPLYGFAIQYGFKPPENLEGWSKFNSLDLWHNYYGSWMDKKMINYTNSIAFLSLLYNKNIKYKIGNRLTKALFNLYQPFAKFRLEKGFHKFPIEMKLNNLVERMRQ